MRLSLEWMDKDRSVITVDGEAVSVDRDDPRVSEVRPFETVELVGDATGGADDNLLVIGDGADAMRTLVRLPEYAERYRGKVKLVYIDPPFNTGQAFTHYDDGIEHSLWLSMMRDRLVLIRDLLTPDGSVWVHLDDNEMAYCRVLMDEVFGRSNFIATVIWQKSYTRENRTAISVGHEYVTGFARQRATWSEARNMLPASDDQLARYRNPDGDSRGPWKGTPAHAKAEKGRRASQFYSIRVPSGRMVEPPLGTCWRYTRERFDELVEDGRIWFGLDGNGVPTVKKFLAEVQAGLVPTALWTHDEVGTSGTAKAEVQALFPETTPFSTPKPEALLERLIQVNSDVGDLVVDVFAGSGTTAAVAHKMGRRWVTTERESATVTTFTLPRLRMVAAGQDPGGATQTAGWTGGGGFRVAKMASSIFAVHDGRVLLSREATNGVFAEGVRAQLGFTTLDEPPFSGRKGRMLLAVVDGVVDENAIQVLVAKADGAAMTVVAKAHTDGAPILLKELSSHSILRKAPTGLLRRRVRGAGR